MTHDRHDNEELCMWTPQSTRYWIQVSKKNHHFQSTRSIVTGSKQSNNRRVDLSISNNEQRGIPEIPFPRTRYFKGLCISANW
jgi:hypothetical protein